jgi:hypothetical protein
MWKSISSQQEICPSSLTSKACLSHRRRPSTSSSAASAQDAPSNRRSISHGDRFSEVCPSALFSLTRSASSVCLPHPACPPFCGAEPKRRRRLEEASTQSTHKTPTDIKRPQATAVVPKYLVYQVLPGVSVSQGTLCLIAPPHPRGLGDVSYHALLEEPPPGGTRKP